MLVIGRGAFAALVIAVLTLMVPSPGRSQERVPIIIVPGIGGSVLAEKANPRKIYFGSVKQSMDQFAKLELPLDRSKDKLVATDIVRQAQLARGTYVDQYNLLIRRLTALGYREGSTLFTFHYDWRRSNFESADALRQFIAASGLSGRPINLIGHSMGGLVGNIYIQKYATEQKVRNFVAMGTPFFGAPKAVRALMEGFAVFGVENYIVVGAGSTGTVYRVFASMESVYELLPNYYDCCYTRTTQTAPMQQVDLARDDALWNRFELFLTSKAGAPGNAAFVRRVRANMIEQRRLVDMPMPPSVRLYAVVGDDAESTIIQFLGAKRGIGKPVWGIGRYAGDGTVPVVSAAGHAAKENIIRSKGTHELLFEDAAIWPHLAQILQ